MSDAASEKFFHSDSASGFHQVPPQRETDVSSAGCGANSKRMMGSRPNGHYTNGSAVFRHQSDFEMLDGLFPVGTDEFLPDEDFINTTPNSDEWEAATKEHILALHNRDAISSVPGMFEHEQNFHPRKQGLDPQDLQQSSQLASKEAEEKAKKVERARNAANHRHHKIIKARRDSRQSGVALDAGEEEGEEKKEEYRAKNRDAAARCRSKKKETTDKLEATHRTLASEQAKLSTTLRSLRNEVTHYRTLLLEHNQYVDGCGCSIIHQYNRQQAHDMVQGRSHSLPIATLATIALTPGFEEATARTRSAPHFGANHTSMACDMASPDLSWTPVTTPDSFDFSCGSATAIAGEDNQYAFADFMENFQAEDQFQHE